MKTKLLLLPVLAALLCCCTKLDKFSNANDLLEFKVKTYSPETIIIDNVLIEGDTVFIPVLFGKYEFPMTFYAEVCCSPTINKVVGLDFSQPLRFDNINSVLKFFVVAENGSTQTYYIKPREIPLSEDNYIYSRVKFNDVDPAETVLSPLTHISMRGDTVKMFGVGLTYPVTCSPEFTIAPTTTFGTIRNPASGDDPVEFVNGETPLTFDSEESVYHLKVIAKSGLVKEWVVSLRNAELIEGTIAETDYPSLGIEPRQSTVSVTPEGWIAEDLLIDHTQGVITVTMANPGVPAPSPDRVITKAAPISDPLTLAFHLSMKDWADPIYVQTDTSYVFENYADVKTCYILDPYTAKARRWTIRLNEFKDDGNTVYSFSYDYTANKIKTTLFGSANTPAIVLDKSNVKIYPDQKLIQLTYTAFQEATLYTNPWQLTLSNIAVTVSPGATFTIPTIEWKDTYVILVYTKPGATVIKSGRTFTVTSEKGETATWTIELVKSGTAQSGACDISSFTINRVLPNYTRFDDYEPVVIDDAASTITLKLKNDDRSYPMSIYAGYTVSDYATVVSQNGGADPLVFANAEATQQVTVRAQNGAERVYTVSLFSPPKAEGADITGIDFGACTPADFSLTAIPVYNAEEGLITLRIEGYDPTFPLEIEYSNVQLTDGASVSLNPTGKFTFANSRALVPVEVTAANGGSKLWNIRLDYRPQLRNWNLDSWADASNINPAGYWALPNNSFGNPSTRTAGWSGAGSDYAVNMKTISILGNKAAGALYLGTFDKSNVTAGLSDPVSLSYFGIPFAPTARIKGIMFDIWYKPSGSDWAAATIELISWNGNGSYVYHGDKPAASKNPRDAVSPHPANTAVRVAKGHLKYTTVQGQAQTTHGDAVTYIPAATWVKDQFIPVNGNVPFTHLTVQFSASAYGDYLMANTDSECKIDNIRIIYED